MSKKENKHLPDFSEEFTRLGQRGVDKAIAENRRLGLPSVFATADGEVYYELPDGTITTEEPEIYQRNEED